MLLSNGVQERFVANHMRQIFGPHFLTDTPPGKFDSVNFCRSSLVKRLKFVTRGVAIESAASPVKARHPILVTLYEALDRKGPCCGLTRSFYCELKHFWGL
jgi:hypothetical protein